MATPTQNQDLVFFRFCFNTLLSSLLDSPFILANDPEAEEILLVVGGLEGSVLTRRHSWISPRFNSEIPLLPLCPGTVATGAPVRSARSVFGGAHPHTPMCGSAPSTLCSGQILFSPHWSHVFIDTVALTMRAQTKNDFGAGWPKESARRAD